MARRPQSTLTIEDLPEGNSGVYTLTPDISRATNTHLGDVEKLIKKKAKAIGEDLYVKINLNNSGAAFTFGPVSELDLSEYEEVETNLGDN